MSYLLGDLYWRLSANSTNAIKEIKKTDTAAKGLGGSFNDTAKLIKGFFTTAAVVGITKVTKELINAASEAEETQNKFDVTFSTITESANSAAEGLSTSFGLSSQKAQQLLSDTGDLLTGFGFTQDSALDLSKQVNELAVDLASFTNFSGGAEGASAALTKALLGERESIKSLGIAITEADIKQLAEEKGIVGELDRQTKAMLTLELAVSQSKNAIGDFARSSDSFANQTRIARAATQDFAVSMGKTLLPNATSAVKLYTQLVRHFTEYSEKVYRASDRSVRLTGATDDLLRISNEYNEIVKKLAENSDTMAAAEKNVLEVRKDILDLEYEQKLQELSKSYDGTINKIERLENKSARLNEELQNNRDRYEELKKSIDSGIVVSIDELTGAMIDNETAILGVESRIFSLGVKITETDTALAESKESQQEAINAIASAYNKGILDISDYAITNEALYKRILETSQVLRDQTEAVKEQKKATEEANAAAERQKELEDIERARLAEIKADRENLIKSYNDELEAIEIKNNLGLISEEAYINERLSAHQDLIDGLVDIGYDGLENERGILDQGDIALREAIENRKKTKEEYAEWEKAQEEKGAEDLIKSLQERYDKEVGILERKNELGLLSDEEYREERLNLEEEYIDQALSIEDKSLNGYQEFLDKRLDMMRDFQDDAIDEWKEFASAVGKIESTFNTVYSVAYDLFSSIGNLINQLTENQLDALEEEKNARLEALGLLEEEEKNQYTKGRKQAEQELSDLGRDLREAKTIEERNDALKEIAEKQAEIDELAAKEAKEEQKLAIEEEYAQKAAQLEYENELYAWKLNLLAASASAAQAVLTAIATAGNIYAGIALATLAGTIGAVNIATVVASKPTPPSYAIGSYDLPKDQLAQVHEGEMIIPKTFAQSLRENINGQSDSMFIGGNNYVNLEVYTTESVETEQEQGPDGQDTYRLFIGMGKKAFQTGEFDTVVTQRFTTTKRGIR